MNGRSWVVFRRSDHSPGTSGFGANGQLRSVVFLGICEQSALAAQGSGEGA
jgi:hypothetical protein